MGIYKPTNNITDNRHLYIGGSDIAKVKTPAQAKQLIKEKRNASDFTSIYTEFGNLLEDTIREHISYILTGGDIEFTPDTKIIPQDNQMDWRANTDGIATLPNGDKYILEVKTVGDNQDWEKKAKEYQYQVGFYQMVFEAPKAVLVRLERPSYLIDKAFADWTVEELRQRKNEIIATLKPELETLKYDLIDRNAEIEAEVLRRVSLINEANEAYEDTIKLPQNDDTKSLVEKYQEITFDIERLEAMRKDILEQITQIEPSEFEYNGAKFTPATTYETTRFNSSAFKKDHADLYEKYMTTSIANRKATLR